MGHDVFISYESHDHQEAYAICNALETARIRCWIAARDGLPGKSYAEGIEQAISNCRVLVLVFSTRANQSEFVKREVECALSDSKVIIPFRIEDIMPSGEMRFYVKNLHWLDAMTPPLESHLARLVETVSRLLGAENTAPDRSGKGALPRARLSGGFEYRSELQVFGYPLVHVAIDLPRVDGRRQNARGLIAIGDNPMGVIALGNFARGVIALGAIPVGVLPVGVLAFGLFPVGALAVGLVAAWGLIAVAPIAIGGVAGGYYCASEFAFGRFVFKRFAPDPEAVRLFEPWLKPRLHAALATLCLVSYLGPKMLKAMKWIAAGRRQS